MSELFDERELRRSLRLDQGERVRLDARALAAAAAAAEQDRFARAVLVGLAGIAILPGLVVARVALGVAADPAVIGQPAALAALLAQPLVDGLSLLAHPATALAVAAAAAIVTVFEGRERQHARTT